jgi:hypothetical protein
VPWKKVVQQVLSLSGAAGAVQALKMCACCPWVSADRKVHAPAALEKLLCGEVRMGAAAGGVEEGCPVGAVPFRRCRSCALKMEVCCPPRAAQLGE